MAPSRVTLDADNMPLAEVLAAIETQTGNRLSDHRVQFGQDAEAVRVTLKIDDAPFWFAVDQVLDATGLDVYSFAGDDALALVGRDDGARSRHGPGYLSGPCRFEVSEVPAIRDLRSPDDHALNVGLDVAWEPRLRPIALSQPLKDVAAIGDNGRPLTVKSQRPVLDVEVPAGNQATMFVLPLNLPSRNVKTITQINGKMTALVPGRRVVFRFADLEAMTAADAKSLTQSRGGVHVTLAAVRKSGAIWEVHMRLRLDDANAALESHRGWVFQNVTYMIDGDGNEIEHAGFETTRQTESEVGCAYLFDVPEEIANYTWVYETPAAIVEFPVEYELRDIPLP